MGTNLMRIGSHQIGMVWEWGSHPVEMGTLLMGMGDTLDGNYAEMGHTLWGMGTHLMEMRTHLMWMGRYEELRPMGIGRECKFCPCLALYTLPYLILPDIL